MSMRQKMLLAFCLLFSGSLLSALDLPYHISRQRGRGGFTTIDDLSVMANGYGQLLRNGQAVQVVSPGSSGLTIKGFSTAGHLYGYRQSGMVATSFILTREGVEYSLGTTHEPVLVTASGTVYAIGSGPASWPGGAIIHVASSLVDEAGNTAGGTNLGTSNQGYALVGARSSINGLQQTVSPRPPFDRLEVRAFTIDGTIYGDAICTPDRTQNVPFQARNNVVTYGNIPGVPPFSNGLFSGGFKLREGWMLTQRRVGADDKLFWTLGDQVIPADDLILTPEQRSIYSLVRLSGQNTLGQLVGDVNIREPEGALDASGTYSVLLTPAALVRPASSSSPTYRSVTVGQPVEYAIDLPSEGGPFEIDWHRGASGQTDPLRPIDPVPTGALTGLNTTRLEFTPTSEAFTTLRVRVFNRYQAEIYTNILRVNAVRPGQTVPVPELRVPPAPQYKYRGQSVAVTATFYSTDATTLRLYRNGQLVKTSLWYPDTTPECVVNLSLGFASYQTAGEYVLTATNSGGQTTTQPFRIQVDEQSTTRLANLSTRARVGTGERALIAGFAVRGGSKRLLVRGLGPSLQPYGISNFLPDPRITVYNSAGQKIRENDDWNVGGAEVQATGLAPADGRECATVLTVEEGTYTVVVEGKDGATGVALVELYDLDAGSAGRLVNLSTRAFVGLDADVVIGGFVLGNGQARPHLIRAIGPSLADFGVQVPLADPNLELNAAGQSELRSDDWRARSNQGEVALIQSAGLAPANEREAVIYSELAPRAYTAIVRGSAAQTGVALVEIYELP
ncbi:MAG: hypothetical protein JSR82_11595 [Verrucomicrobia bacterium]|nr:hypothetical protein [Verrucomicrobiota bacterium]